MAEVTKPVALNESLNTTDSTPKNIADVLKDKLGDIASAISGGGGGSGGHTIQNASGANMPQETTMQFKDSHVTDNSQAGKTEVEVIKSVASADYSSETEDGLYLIPDGDGSVIEPASEDYVEVTADGNTTWANLLKALFNDAKFDIAKVSKDSILSYSTNGTKEYYLHEYFINGTTSLAFSSYADSAYDYAEFNGSFGVLKLNGADASSNKPTNGTKITLYYGNKKAVVDLQTTANRCLLTDGRNVQQAVALNNLDSGINISAYTSSSPYIFPSDGYITLSISGGTYANGYLKGSTSGEIWIDMHEAKQVIHVRKGMKAYFTSGNGTPVAYFIPFS